MIIEAKIKLVFDSDDWYDDDEPISYDHFLDMVKDSISNEYYVDEDSVEFTKVD